MTIPDYILYPLAAIGALTVVCWIVVFAMVLNRKFTEEDDG